MQLVARVVHAVPVVRVDDEDEALRVLVVVAPERADLVLTSDVPDRERDVLVLDRLDVETDRGDRRDDLGGGRAVFEPGGRNKSGEVARAVPGGARGSAWRPGEDGGAPGKGGRGRTPRRA